MKLPLCISIGCLGAWLGMIAVTSTTAAWWIGAFTVAIIGYIQDHV